MSTTSGGRTAVKRPSSGTVIWYSESTSSRYASNSSSARSISSMSSTGGGVADVVDGLQQRSLEQEALVVQLLLERAGGEAERLAGGLGGAQVQQLAAVVPVVHGLRDVDALVALQADQLAARPPAEHLGDLGLADAGLAFQQQRAAQRHREEHRRGEAVVGDVAVQAERVRDVGGSGGLRGHCACRLGPDGRLVLDGTPLRQIADPRARRAPTCPCSCVHVMP